MIGGIGGSSLAVSLLGLVNVGLGVINQVIIASYFGTSAQLDSFLIASAVPSVLGGIALSLFSSSLVPMLTPIRHLPREISKAVTTVTVLTAIATVLIVACGVCARGAILSLSTSLGAERLELGTRLSGYIWIITGFVILNAFCASLFNLLKQFIFPAVVGLLPTLGMIVGTLTLGSTIGIEGLVIGWLGMAILSCVALIPVLAKCGLAWKELRIERRYAEEFLSTLMPVAVGLLPFTILPTIDAYWVSRLPEGSMSYIGYCFRIVTGIGSLVVSGMYVVILPYLSENVADNDLDAFVRRLRLAIKCVLLITIPLVTFFAFFGREVVTVLFQRGHFDEKSTGAVSSLLPFYLVGLLAMPPATILSRGYFALKRYQGFSFLSLAAVAVYWVLSGVLSRYYSFYGIGFTYGIYWVLFLSTGVFLLDRSMFNSDTLRSPLKCSVCSVIGSAVAYVVFSDSIRLPIGLTLLLEGCLATALFLLLAHALKVTELESIRIGVLALARK
jgi:putative peptidoglycan lipid II flippase